ncbi:efflux RND transporter periplasmic adaptor subunit [Polaromonas sp.]|uniref:efflux RND transporter periplasmic adaptor subunit n=1 Tax=Polaromonas sp. TaxID=1869339 RepID=UPI0013B73AE0|nr:efflux RND transporter periplasmic adaptor subunit [Polaromonas sp.]NDP63724.1 efflux RND transporter periplasmic adaptor subunit [Polaromonas sp.]
MASKVIYTVIAVAGIAAASGAAWWYQKPKPAGAAGMAVTASGQGAGSNGTAAKPPSVEVARVELARLVDDTRAVGSLRSRRGVVLRPEISGRITQLNFTDGQRVKKGQVLVQFDDQLPQAQVQQSQAELSIARANQKRNQELVAQNFISQRSLDESEANLQVAQAKLALAKATAARLKIVAPFDGIAGIRQVNVGDYLKDGADIVNIEDIDAIYVDFRLPERYQSKVKRGQTALLDIDALPGQGYTAQIQAIDPLIDANGRSVGIRGCIDNRALQLRPGMFARVNAVFGVRDNASVIPEEAIVPQSGKQFVIKLLEGPSEETRKTQRVEVKVGLRSPGKVEILEGLLPGDTVVRTGQQRIQKDGTVVRVVKLNGGASVGEAAMDKKPADTASTAPVSSVATSVKAAPAGPNPCGIIVSQLPASGSVMPTSSTDPAVHKPALPPVRNPG